MNYYAISFTISFIGDRDSDEYSEVRRSFLNAIKALGDTYEETTSFVLLKTDSSMTSVIEAVSGSLFDSNMDSFIAMPVVRSSILVLGKNPPPTI